MEQKKKKNTQGKKDPAAKLLLTKGQKIFLSLAAGFALPFLILVCGTGEIFAGNCKELDFVLFDFYWVALLIFLGVFAALSTLLLLLKGKAFDIAFGVVLWLSIMCFAQSLFLNVGNSLSADELASDVPPGIILFDVLVWVGVGFGIFWLIIKSKDKNLLGSLAAILLVMVIAVEGINLGSAFAEGNESPVRQQVLTNTGMFEVSDKDNVFVILLDRFDLYYYNEVKRADPTFFDRLDGFTLYDNNISLYSRTYPAIAYMVSGLENDFSGTREAYFKKAYGGSDLFHDLKSNGYKVKLYTGTFYGYEDADCMEGLVDNISKYDGDCIRNRGKLTGNMIQLSLYRYLPTPLKSAIKIGTSDLSGFVVDNTYLSDDADVWARLRDEGLTVTSEGEGNFTFLHLNGCHTPYTMDENGNKVDNHYDSVAAVKGCFGFIYDFIDQLKELGLFENSTIIITGDHARAMDDTIDVEDARVTTLFVKEKGQKDTALLVSHAPVCQENLRAEIVKSAGLSTDRDYGAAFSDIAEDADVKRKYLFEKYVDGGDDELVVYEVVGDANNFDNWTLVDRIAVGYIYK